MNSVNSAKETRMSSDNIDILLKIKNRSRRSSYFMRARRKVQRNAGASPDTIESVLDRLFFEDESRNVSDAEAKRPAVSVVVPVHDTREYIEECIQSLVNQSHADLEIILVDDCSPDDSAAIIFSHMLLDPRIIYVKTRKNRGLLLVRQIGARFATGDYITFVDSDDFVAPDIYERALKKAREHDADILQFAMWRMPEDDELAVRESTICPDPLIKGGDIFRAYLQHKIDYSMCNKLIKLDLWRQCAIYYPTRHYKLEDMSRLPYLCLFAKTFVSIRYSGYYYRIRKGSGARVKTIGDRGWRAYSAARHLARLKLTLANLRLLDKYINDLGAYERSVYDTYVKHFIAAANYRRREFHRLLEETEEEKLPVISRALSTLMNSEDSNIEILLFNSYGASDVDLLSLDLEINRFHYSVGKKWLRRIYRINGYIPLRPYISVRNELIQELDERLQAINKPDNELPLVSIIVPAYNIEGVLGRCLTSLSQQTYNNFEAIIVNDCSTDDTERVIDAWCTKDPRFRKINNPENRGLFRTRIAGLRHARGSYIWHVDGDDYVSPIMLESLMRQALRHGTDIVQCGRIEIDEEGKEKKNLARNVPAKEFGDIYKTLLSSGGISHSIWNKIYRADLWIAAQNMLALLDKDEEIRRDCGEDFAFNALVLPCAQKFVHVPNAYYYYSVRSDSFMDKKNKDIDYMETFFINSVRNIQIAMYMMNFLKRYDKNSINKKNREYTLARLKEICANQQIKGEHMTEIMNNASRYFSPLFVACMGLHFANRIKNHPVLQESLQELNISKSSGKARSKTSSALVKEAKHEGTRTHVRMAKVEERLVRKFVKGKKFDKYIMNKQAFFADSRNYLVRAYGKLMRYY